MRADYKKPRIIDLETIMVIATGSIHNIYKYFFTVTGLSRSNKDSRKEKKKRFCSSRWSIVNINFSLNNSDMCRNIVITSYMKRFETNIKTFLI